MNWQSNPSEFCLIYPILKVTQFFLNESVIHLCSDSASLPYATGKFHYHTFIFFIESSLINNVKYY